MSGRVEPSADDLHKVLETCNSEPVHIIGHIQSYAHLLAFNAKTGVVQYASENIGDILGSGPKKAFGQTVQTLFGNEAWHGIRNAMAHAAGRRMYAFNFDGKRVFVVLSGEHVILEIEENEAETQFAPEKRHEQAFLLDKLRQCQNENDLFDLTTRLLRHTTGFDRVMIYKFDEHWNGEILAEDRVSTVEPFLGLRFPHWDIPEQARAIMKEINLRLVADVWQDPIAILPENPELPPLDITQVEARGVAVPHLMYLRNMGVAATMTLSVVFNDRLWGMISFHHKRPKLVPFEIRQILTTGVLPIFCLKLEVLLHQRALDVSREVEAVQGNVQNQLRNQAAFTDVFDEIGSMICTVMEATGLAVVSGENVHRYGEVPPGEVLHELGQRAKSSGSKPFSIGSFEFEAPDLFEATGGGGVLAVATTAERMLLVFRPEIRKTVKWAGEPSKTIETVSGQARLSPRGSFAAYLEETRGYCQVWSDQDKLLVEQLWPLLSALERQEFMSRVARQQDLMISELNHRVRNILALVKSVSTQAGTEGGSLDGYRQALEARIYALAAANDIGTGEYAEAVPFSKIIALETAPFADADKVHVQIAGSDFRTKPEFAPLLALAIHELMTNAVKYGALSVPEGRISIETLFVDGGVSVTWEESGGPAVRPSTRAGFGTVLIRDAVPFEMNGTSELEFRPAGVFARLWLPNEVLSGGSAGEIMLSTKQVQQPLGVSHIDGPVMIVEDKFIIAADLKADIATLGFQAIEIFPDRDSALDFLTTQTPALAVLDFSLGGHQTSEAVALKLQEMGVPTMFVTGHGDRIHLDHRLSQLPVLTKPVARSNLEAVVSKLLAEA